jgi:TonB family protein
MMAITLANLIAYSAQIALVALVGGALLTALRVQTPHIRYGSWRVLLALCLALPWLQTPQVVRSTPSAVSTTPVTSLDLAPLAATTVGAPPQPWTDWIGPVLIAGAVLRLLWIGLGCLRLERLRRRGEPASDPSFDDIARAIGARAEIRYVPQLSQPVMFGVRRPVILLPERLRDAPADIRQAVAAHELWHVRRRDWLWLIGEELVRAGLWFQPVIWWLIARIRASREEVVDGLSIAATGRRQSYLRALVAFADGSPLAGAAAFGWRRHLFQRIVQIGREEAMSSRRLVGSLILLMFVVALSGWYAVSAFPLTRSTHAQQASGPGPIERTAVLASPDQPAPRRIHEEQPVYPSDPAARLMSARITMRATVDERGEVAEARVTAIEFATASVSASLRGDDVMEKLDPFVTTRMKDRQGNTMTGAEIKPLLEAFADSALNAIKASRYEAPPRPVTFDVTIHFAGQQPEAAAETSPLAVGAIRVGGEVKPPAKITDVRPIYPNEARAAGIQGVVILEVRIEADGRVGQARILRSIPALDEAAIDAVRQWQFTPTLLNGTATPVVMTVTVQFLLG